MSKSYPRKKLPVPPALKLKKRPIGKADPCAAVKADLKRASAIVGQVLAHFGAGAAVEREKTAPGSTAQLFADFADLKTFHDLLVKSTLKHLTTLNWETQPPSRDFVCRKAFAHGVLAYQKQLGPLTFAVILDTLREIQETCPVGGAGGGKVCDF